MPTYRVLPDSLPNAERRLALQNYSRAAFQTTAGCALVAMGIPLLVAGPLGVLTIFGGSIIAAIGMAKAVDAARKVRTTFGVIDGWLAPFVTKLLDFTG